MIAVIADDFTGAAEIGGIGLRHGLSVVIETEIINSTDADLLIIAADTRSLPEEEATKTTTLITRELLKLNPEFIYKKIDSALRGNIAVELLAQMAEMKMKKSIIVAANPIFNRTINQGIYYIENMPLNETNFSSDPEYPATSALVKELIGKSKYIVHSSLTPGDSLPENGLIAGDVNDFGDLEAWAGRIDENTIPAGSSGFFNAILSKHLSRPQIHKAIIKPFGEKALYILGSTFPKNDNFLSKIAGYGYPISSMPHEIYFNRNYPGSLIDNWATEIIRAFDSNNKVFLNVPYSKSNENDISCRIKDVMGLVIKKVTDVIDLDDLIIEGGGTTSQILKHLNITRLIPFQEIETGVIRMKMEPLKNLTLTTKPGSYLWPDSVWLSHEINITN
jgi:uncharacterized protein YgbK (DUF1537 family)